MRPRTNEHRADLVAEELDRRARGVEVVIGAQRHHDPPDVDEVEADDEQMIDGVGQHFIAVERLDEKGAAVAVQRSRYPDR